MPRAVAWYAHHDRIHVAPSRVDTLVAMADAWVADVAAGHDSALLAWRRQDVADLDRLARQRWDHLGRLTGDDVKVAGGRHDAVSTPRRICGEVHEVLEHLTLSHGVGVGVGFGAGPAGQLELGDSRRG